MLRYYKLFDLLFRKNMKLNDLKEILSSATIAKLRKGEYISGEALDKICEFLVCQPEDIMEHYRLLNKTDKYQSLIAIKTKKEDNEYGEDIPSGVKVLGIEEPLNDKGYPVHGWYEKEIYDTYNNLDDWDKSFIDYGNALLTKNINDKLKELGLINNPNTNHFEAIDSNQ